MNAIEAIRGLNVNASPRLRCGVCGFSEVRTDEVLDRDLVYLAECPRCEYRWASREPIAVATRSAPAVGALRRRVAACLRREVRPAA